MKSAFIGLLLVLASASCQTTADACVADLRQSMATGKGLLLQIAGSDTFAMMSCLMKAVPALKSTMDKCKAITPADLVSYTIARLNQAQKDCLKDALVTLDQVMAQFENLKEKRISALISGAPLLLASAKNTQNLCADVFENN